MVWRLLLLLLPTRVSVACIRLLSDHISYILSKLPVLKFGVDLHPTFTQITQTPHHTGFVNHPRSFSRPNNPHTYLCNGVAGDSLRGISSHNLSLFFFLGLSFMLCARGR